MMCSVFSVPAETSVIACVTFNVSVSAACFFSGIHVNAVWENKKKTDIYSNSHMTDV